MQKYLKEYLDELGKKQKKLRRTRIAIVVLVVLVVTGIAGILSQYGVAMTGTAKCGLEEHQHGESCYEKVLTCGLEEGESHTHTEECQYPPELTCGLEETEGHTHTEECQYPPELTCGLEESEEHTHTEECYTIPEGYACGLEESEGHTHTEECYTIPEGYACGLEETEGHKHTDDCYTGQLVCGKEEHIHTDACYIDTGADVEEQAVWDNQYAAVEWKGVWGEDLTAAARMQIGYQESINNYTVAEDGSHKGYTRYGQFVNNIYCSWDAAFVNFCMHYAGLKESGFFPEETDTAKWQEEFIKINEANAAYLTTPEAYQPAVGDLVFFQKENEETTDQMGIVSAVNADTRTIKVIEGNNANEVKETEYSLDDAQNHIVGYLNITGLESAYKNAAAQSETAEGAVQPEAADPAGTEAVVTPDAAKPEEAIIELTTEVDGTIITLSGPESSFETDKELSIEAEKVENEETIETIEEALEQVTEEKEQEVKEYQAFDIRLYADGEEVQPLGPVEVKFSGREVKEAVKDEQTEVNVLHVDEETGEATDMEATATEENEVVIETEHFSVYVYVKLESLFGNTNITVQHWADGFQTIDSDSIINAIDGDNTSIFEDAGTYSTITGKEEPDKKVRQKSEKKEIYSTDEITFPNEYYTTDIRNLSKLYKSESLNYTLKKIWITTDWSNATLKNGFDSADGWRDYVECWLDGQNQPDKYYSKQGTGENIADNDAPGADVKLEINDDTIKIGNKVLPVINKDNPVLVRFWYEPTVSETTHQFDTPTVFYDYDISEKVDGKKVYSDEKGINSPINYDNTSTNNRLGVGQYSSGNISVWSQNAQYNGLFLNKGNATIVQNIVRDTLDSNGQLQFNVNAPRNLFGSPEDKVSKGATAYTNYNLQFLRNGDTYTLESVYNETTDQTVKSASSLSKFMYFGEKWSGGSLYSNNFWPMDEVKNADPHMGKTNEQYDFYKDNASQRELSSPIADDKSDHNCYFGMTYEIKFTVGDYTGPMEYYFRGDDDFWLFVDGQRVIDIGGIHAAVGQSIDLRAWMEQRGMLAEGKLQEEHTLKVFYMERGASGSCCYMQFTIPDATPVPTPTIETANYEVEKKWDDNDNPFRPGSIVVQLQQITNTDEGRTITPTSETVELSEENNWKHEWIGLPSISGSTQGEYKYTYSVKEINLPAGYRSEVDENGVLTNTLEPVKVKVKKEWENDTDLKTYRPDSVTLRLYANGEPYKDDKEKSEENPEGYRDITLNEAGGWEGEIENLPEYYYELASDGTDSSDASNRKYNSIPIQYSVREIVNGAVVDEGGAADGKSNSKYMVNYTEAEGDTGYAATLTATNTLQTSFQIVKKAKLNDEPVANGRGIKGAEFTLVSYKTEGSVSGGTAAETKSYTGKSDENGVIKWKENSLPGENVPFIPAGTYLLEETKAPEGYALSGEKWMITVNNYGRAEIKGEDGAAVDLPDNEINLSVDPDTGTVIFAYTFHDEIIYKLPSTGGPGIYWYMFGGVLFMAAASLIAYKKKHREVFGK